MGLRCPATLCNTENDPEAEECKNCGTPLQGYARLSAYPSYLFNQGIVAVSQGEVSRARDLFAAIVYWCPLDIEARNALATACLALGDKTEARRHWQTVLARAATNTTAKQGLTVLENASQSKSATKKQHGNRRRKRRRGKSKRK